MKSNYLEQLDKLKKASVFIIVRPTMYSNYIFRAVVITHCNLNSIFWGGNVCISHCSIAVEWIPSCENVLFS